MKNKGNSKKSAVDDLCEAFLQLENIKQCENFLRDLCTPAEIQAFVDRWQVARLLAKDVTYREVCAQTGVSTATVTRVARFLFNGFNGYQSILEKRGELKRG
jgi:TrpR-related protein YerC/YecD